MTIWATGANGIIGSKLPQYVKPLIFNSNGIEINILHQIQSGDTVVHLAAVVGEAKCKQNPGLATDINVLAVRKLAEQVLSVPNVQLIYASTGHVYGPANSPRTESDVTNPQTLYAELKLRGEIEVQKIFSMEKNRLSITRIFSILDRDLAFNSLPSRVLRILNNQEDSKSILNSDDVRDFQTRAEIILMLERIWSSKIAGVINICSSSPMSVKEACLDFVHKLEIPGAAGILKFEPGVSAMPYLVGNREKLNLLNSPGTFEHRKL
jgi:nucleoside-diphosphate-sugar epimerase